MSMRAHSHLILIPTNEQTKQAGKVNTCNTRLLPLKLPYHVRVSGDKMGEERVAVMARWHMVVCD